MDLNLIRQMALEGVSVDDRLIVMMVDYIKELEDAIAKAKNGKR